MIINGVNYKITFPLVTDWKMNITRRKLSSGFYRITENNYSTDTVTSIVMIQGLYTEIEPLLNYIDTVNSLGVTFNNGEKVFGSHVDYSSSINCLASIIGGSNRINQNLYTVSISLITKNLPLDSSVTPGLNNLWYPANYSAGVAYGDELTNTDTYGNSNTYFSYKVGKNSLSFDLDKTRSAELIRACVETIRGDGFVLPASWQTLNPFGEEGYTHAIILGLSFSQNNFSSYNVTLDLQGYNNG